jgi:hypothetical protein
MSESRTPHPASARLRGVPGYHFIPFDPVPVKPRHDGWTPERQRGFIDRLVVTGSVARSARAVGMTPQSADKLRKHEGAESFRRAWDEALASGRSFVRDVAICRAIEGEQVPVMYRGRRVGTKRRYDNGLLIAVLNSAPDRSAPNEDPSLAFQRALAELEAELERQGRAGPSLETKDFLRPFRATSSTLQVDDPDELGGLERRGAEKALVEVAAFLGEESKLLLGLNPFRDHSEAERARHVDHSAHDDPVSVAS